MNPMYSLIASIITGIIGYLLSMKRYRGYYHGFKGLMKAIRMGTEELGWKKEYELADTITEMLKDNKVSNKEIRKVVEESEDVYQDIMDLYNKYYREKKND